MVQRSRRSAKTVQAAEQPQQDATLDGNREGFELFIQSNEAIMSGMAALSAEMIEFGNRRIRENIACSESLSHCSEAEEALRVQYEFYQAATQQYLDQTNRMLNLMTKITGDFWAPLQERTFVAMTESKKESP